MGVETEVASTGHRVHKKVDTCSERLRRSTRRSKSRVAAALDRLQTCRAPQRHRMVAVQTVAVAVVSVAGWTVGSGAGAAHNPEHVVVAVVEGA